jgi:hypothetical protein
LREFKEKINKKNPDDAPIIYVEDIEEIQLALKINQTVDVISSCVMIMFFSR